MVKALSPRGELYLDFVNAAEAVLPEELVEVVEGVGSGHFVQALHPAQALRGGLQQLRSAPLAFVPRRRPRAPHLQRAAAARPGLPGKPAAAKKRLVEKVSPLTFKCLLAFHRQSSGEERHIFQFRKGPLCSRSCFLFGCSFFSACFNLYKQHFSKLLLHEHQFTQTII